MVFEIRDSDQKVVAILDDSKSCNAMSYNDCCGGCDSCVLLQSEFYGYDIKEVSDNTKEDYFERLGIE